MRVLISTSTFPRFHGDNVTPFMADLVLALASRGIELDVLAPHSPGSKKIEDFGNGVTVHRFRYAWPEKAENIFYGAGALENLKSKPLKAMKLPFVAVAQAAATYCLARSRRYDLIHAHWVIPQGITALPSCLGRTALVVTAHGSDVLGLQGRLPMWAKQLVVRHASFLTANSVATANALHTLSADPDRVEIVPIGASLRPAETTIPAGRDGFADEASPLLLFVGRLIDCKGADDAVAALALLQNRLPHARLVVVGDGPERQALEAKAASLGISDRILFTGWLQPANVIYWMRRGDVLIIPSRRAVDGTMEAQGVVPLEAMLHNLPVIASRCGGLVDIIRHEETGLLVAERSPGEISDAVETIVTNKDFATRLSARAKEWVLSEGTMARTAERFHEIYQRVLSVGG
ncbi:glycosyltransferase [Mesorhizobium delmotii]|uniref:Glycosyltransferase n=1 Tax=Mesorhizobium delmotii TaxID=1631247 RepID=A0A2P9AJJ8_9HYPH|nr:glycosyltransferase [Mesorhizobium delmotii]SJM31304.1 Glycosyltransferase [Mesorhizobium delmotii]